MTTSAERCGQFRLRVCSFWLVAMLLGSTVLQPTQAQTPSIEELEQRLQRAKEEKARRDAAAARSRAESEAAQNKRNADAARAEAERKGQEARQGNLVIQADAACTLSVNGKEVAQLPKGITELKISPGQKLVSCASRDESISFEGQVEARSGQDTVLRITLAERVEAVQRSRREAEEKVQRDRRDAEEMRRVAEVRAQREAWERAQREAEARTRADEAARRFPTVSEGVLFDEQSGLQWTRADNGRDVNWSQAQAHCQGLGSDWSLPTGAQLRSLYDKNLPGIPCGSYSCNVVNQFRLSSAWFWSSESKGFSEAWLVKLSDGFRYSTVVGNTTNRALCVRRP